MKIPLRLPVGPPRPILPIARPALRPVAIQRPLVRPIPRPLPPRPPTLSIPAMPCGSRPLFYEIGHNDGFTVAKNWADTATQKAIFEAVVYLAQSLGNVHRHHNNKDFASKFKLPGELVSPDPELTKWAGEGWSNFDWLADVMFTLAAYLPREGYPFLERLIYFHSVPEDVRFKGPVEFKTCPVLILS